MIIFMIAVASFSYWKMKPWCQTIRPFVIFLVFTTFFNFLIKLLVNNVFVPYILIPQGCKIINERLIFMKRKIKQIVNENLHRVLLETWCIYFTSSASSIMINSRWKIRLIKSWWLECLAKAKPIWKTK